MVATDEIFLLFKAMRRIARAIDIHSRRIDRDIGLTLPQLVVLSCVFRLGEVTSRAISHEADLSPATVVGILDNLENKGLITRHRSGVDRRIVHTRLTQRGRQLAEHAPPPLGEAFGSAFARMDPDERRTAVRAFGRIADLIDPPVADEAAGEARA